MLPGIVSALREAAVVTTAVATKFVVTVPATAVTGTAFNFSVQAKDEANNNVPNYFGTVHFISSDGLATLPANTTLTNGAGTFSATLGTQGNWTITATDTVNAALNGTSNLIAASRPRPPVTQYAAFGTAGVYYWTVPANWTDNANSIQCIGGGGGGAGAGGNVGTGGGGGAYARSHNSILQPGQVLVITVGAGGGWNAAGGGTLVQIQNVGNLVYADCGRTGLPYDYGQGGQAGNSIGQIRYSGGNGGGANNGVAGSGGGAAATFDRNGGHGGNGGAGGYGGGGGGGTSGGPGADGSNVANLPPNLQFGGGGAQGWAGVGAGLGGQGNPGGDASYGGGGGGSAGGTGGLSNTGRGGHGGATYGELGNGWGAGGGGGGSGGGEVGTTTGHGGTGGYWGGGGGGAGFGGDTAGGGPGWCGLVIISWGP